MATLVKFLKEDDGNILAVFPQLNYNKRLYGNKLKLAYVHMGQHTSCSLEYAKTCNMATSKQYTNLLTELKQQGYTELKVLNK